MQQLLRVWESRRQQDQMEKQKISNEPHPRSSIYGPCFRRLYIVLAFDSLWSLYPLYAGLVVSVDHIVLALVKYKVFASVVLYSLLRMCIVGASLVYSHKYSSFNRV